MNQQTREQAAETEYSKISMLRKVHTWKEGFLAGCDFMEEQASEGFEEYVKSRPDYYVGLENLRVTHDRKVWQAAKLVAQKELKEKDERIKVAEAEWRIYAKSSESLGMKLAIAEARIKELEEQLNFFKSLKHDFEISLNKLEK